MLWILPEIQHKIILYIHYTLLPSLNYAIKLFTSIIVLKQIEALVSTNFLCRGLLKSP